MRHLESNFQIQVVNFLRNNGFLVFAVPNAGSGKLSLKQGALLKREGLLAGVSDLIIVLQHGRTVFAELKNPNGTGRQSQSQKDFEKNVRERGHIYVIWENWEQVTEFIKSKIGER